MRKSYAAKAFSYPQPVFIIATYNEDGTADAMNAAWGGISDTTELSICLSESVDAPVINELAVCMECTVKSYDPETGRLVGEIVNVSVDESAMTDGKVDVAKVAPITFDPFNNAYHVLGEKVGNAFSDGLALR